MPERVDAALGIDVGASKVALGIVARDGTIVARDRIENRAFLRRALLDKVARRAADLAEAAPADVALLGVGVGICELVDPNGEIVSSTSLSWSRADLVEHLGQLGPVAVESDVRAAARAEAAFGSGRSYSSFGYVTVGTGISSCLVLEGEPWPGAHGAAQLLGSGSLTLPCPQCGNQHAISLEEIASGAALATRYRHATGSSAPDAKSVFAAADNGDAVARDLIEEAADTLGAFLAMFVNITDPEALVVGGGLGSTPGRFRERAFAAVRRHAWAPAVRSLPLLPAQLGPEAGVVGAGWQVLRRRETEAA